MEEKAAKIPAELIAKYGPAVVAGLLKSRLPLIKPTPPPPHARVLLIRHALSTMNFESYVLESHDGLSH